MAKLFKHDLLIILFLILAVVPLRFTNLGYSEFQDDEKKAFMRLLPQESVSDFLIRQRKGPMQFFVSYVPRIITGDFKNEVAQRLPFTLFNIASVVVLYLLLKRVTNSTFAGVFGSLLFATNGFIVGFSRIAQYQNLNLFFSFLALYLYSKADGDRKNVTTRTMAGTFFFCLSTLSHWDVIFYLIPAIYFFAKILARKDLEVGFKLKVTLVNLGLGLLLLLPFLIPYINFHSQNLASTEYFQKRVGVSSYGLAKHRFIFELYNPYFTLPIYLVLGVLSLVLLKKNAIYLVWFLVNFAAIRYFMAKPGTHIYNYVLPLMFMITMLFAGVWSKAKAWPLKLAIGLLALIASCTFYFQSYLIFVDHKQEYPWDAKKIFGYATEPYKEKEILTFGFPHFRGWKNINEFIKSDADGCDGYLTNEDKSISQIYLDIFFGDTKDCYYIISVKRPFVSTRDGVIFSQAKKDQVVYRYTNNGEILTRLYKIPAKVKNTVESTVD